MITVQFTLLEDFFEEIEAQRAHVADPLRLTTFAQPIDPDHSLHITEAGVLVGEQLWKLTLLARTPEGAEAQAAQVERQAGKLDLGVNAGRFEAS